MDMRSPILVRRVRADIAASSKIQSRGEEDVPDLVRLPIVCRSGGKAMVELQTSIFILTLAILVELRERNVMRRISVRPRNPAMKGGAPEGRPEAE